MNHKRPPVPVIVVVLLILAASAYFIITQTMGGENGALTASGFIETTRVNIAPELAGKVTEVLVTEGQPVRQGDTLMRLDGSLLNAQREVASSGLELCPQRTAHRAERPRHGAGTIRRGGHRGAHAGRLGAPHRLGLSRALPVRPAVVVLLQRGADRSRAGGIAVLPARGWSRHRRTWMRSSRISPTPSSSRRRPAWSRRASPTWSPRRSMTMPRSPAARSVPQT